MTIKDVVAEIQMDREARNETVPESFARLGFDYDELNAEARRCVYIIQKLTGKSTLDKREGIALFTAGVELGLHLQRQQSADQFLNPGLSD
jgi:hypothetical protein